MELANAFILWSILWTCVLRLGYFSENAIRYFNLLHGICATFLSSFTIISGWDDKFCAGCSIAFFVVDVLNMLRVDMLQEITHKSSSSARSSKRSLEYIHHAIGIVFGVFLTTRQSTICAKDCSIANLYIYAQVNELSTPFYNIYLMTKIPLFGIAFAATFFFCRIVFNFLTIVPVSFKNCTGIGFIIIMVPYQTLQCVWMYMIVRKVVISKSSSGKEKFRKGMNSRKPSVGSETTSTGSTLLN